MSRRAWVYIIAVILVAVALAAFALTQPVTLVAENAALLIILIIAATLSQLFKARFKSRIQSERGASAYSPMLIFLFAGTFLLPSSLYVLLVTIPHLIEWANERLKRSVSLANWYIQPFNISTFLIAGLVALWMRQSLNLGDQAFSITAIAFVMSLATLYVVINHYLVGQVLVLARDVTWRETGVWRADNLAADFFMLLYGAIIPGLWQLNPWLVVPALSPLYLIQRALAIPQLRRDEQALQRAKDDLESIVDERTAELRRAYQSLQTISQQMVQIQEDERARLARELHDQIGQTLTVVKINLQTLRRSPQALALAPWLDESIQDVERAMGQVRDLSRDLRPAVLDDLGLGAALRSYIDRQAEVAGLELEVVINPPDLHAAPHVETACFRIVQEAVTNIMRHARAKHVRVELQQHDAELELRVRDDGDGFDPVAVRERIKQEGGLGLLGIQERIMLIGGHVEIHSAPGQGTEIHARVPVELPGNGAILSLLEFESGVVLT